MWHAGQGESNAFSTRHLGAAPGPASSLVASPGTAYSENASRLMSGKEQLLSPAPKRKGMLDITNTNQKLAQGGGKEGGTGAGPGTMVKMPAIQIMPDAPKLQLDNEPEYAAGRLGDEEDALVEKRAQRHAAASFRPLARVLPNPYAGVADRIRAIEQDMMKMSDLEKEMKAANVAGIFSYDSLLQPDPLIDGPRPLSPLPQATEDLGVIDDGYGLGDIEIS
jgi:hypothetical protein